MILLVRSAIVEIKESSTDERGGHVTLYSLAKVPDEAEKPPEAERLPEAERFAEAASDVENVGETRVDMETVSETVKKE